MNIIPIEVKKTCLEMQSNGVPPKQIYSDYFVKQFDEPQSYASFSCSLGRWKRKIYPDSTTLENGTYKG